MAKPIFVMRFRNSLSDSEFLSTKGIIYQSDISKEYHIIALKNDKDKDEFEMFSSLYNFNNLSLISLYLILNLLLIFEIMFGLLYGELSGELHLRE